MDEPLSNLDANLRVQMRSEIKKLHQKLQTTFIYVTHDQTEALTAIDVNTGKFTGKESIEKTVLKVNSEATIEIAKQIRARDIGGIVIIDYIDMDSNVDEEIIQNLLLENLKKDRAKTQVVGFTKLHLLEMTRKHICS